MSCAAKNSASRVDTVKPSVFTLLRARSSRSPSCSIQLGNSWAKRLSACSARATGSSSPDAGPFDMARLRRCGGEMTSWSAYVATEGSSLRDFDISSRSRSGVEAMQAIKIDARAAPSFRSGVAGGIVAAAVRAEIAFCPDEASWIGDHVDDAVVQRGGRDRLHHELGHARIPRSRHAPALG